MSKRNAGHSFESELETAFLHFSGRGELRVKKSDPPIKTFGHGPFKRVIHLKNPFLDFLGCWPTRGGRAVFIEAKSSMKPVLPFGGKLTQEQMDALRHWHNAGAVAFVLWECRGEVRMFPWLTIECILINGRRHAKHGEGLLVERRAKHPKLDVVGLMERLWPDRASIKSKLMAF